MIDFLKRLFGGAETSSTTAKDRLRLVLMTDHIALAPDTIEQMKRDLIEVISRYVEVDRDKVEVNFEREDKVLAMLANIPITAVNRPTGDGAAKPAAKPSPSPAVAAATPVAASPAASARVVSAGGAPPMKRRRRRKGQSAVAQPTPVHHSAPAQ